MLIDSPLLRELGWSSFFDDQFTPYVAAGYVPARVAMQHRGGYLIYAEAGELAAELAGRMRGDFVRRVPGKLAYEDAVAAQLPATGDWVAASVRPVEGAATIHATLPRRTEFSRKEAWTATARQVLAANVDTVFVAFALTADGDTGTPANLRRLERYLALAHESGARPVIVLTKADLRDDAHDQARALAVLGVAVVATSAVKGEGLDALAPYLPMGETVALLGSSGVGKSTLINTLLGTERLATREVRRDGLGRHTTTTRELIRLPGGGLVIDTPGMREIQLWDADEGLGAAFGDIEELARGCRFRDCGHRAEPGCAVRAGLESGLVDGSRLASLRKLERELEHLETKQSKRAASERKKAFVALHRAARKRARP